MSSASILPLKTSNSTNRKDSGHSFSNPVESFKKSTLPETPPTKAKYFEFVKFQRNVLDTIGYFGFSYNRLLDGGVGPDTRHQYQISGNPPLATFLYWILHLNATIKGIFLAFLTFDYFGPVEFTDRIASVDFILCVIIVFSGCTVFLKKYPFFEVLRAKWILLDSIYWKLGCPKMVREKVRTAQRKIMFQHCVIVFGGCTALMIQYFPNPKYINFTYTSFKLDTWYLRGLFGMHEFLFMMMSWNGYSGPSSLCMYQGVAVSALIDEMDLTVKRLFKDAMTAERVHIPGQGIKWTIHRETLQSKTKAPNTEYNIETILSDYRQLMLICHRFNESVSYKTLFLHVCGVAQFTADVYSGFHVLRQPGAGLIDVWFFIWDCSSAGFMLLRVYHFMGLVYDSAEVFMQTLREYVSFPNMSRRRLRRVLKTLKIVSLNVGPCKVFPETVLGVWDIMGNYYVCAALW